MAGVAGGAFSDLAFDNDSFFGGIDAAFKVDRVIIARQLEQPRQMLARPNEEHMSVADLGVIYQGDTLLLRFLVQDQNGNAQDLTDCTVKWGLAPATDMDAPTITKTIGSGVTVVDAEGGECEVLIDQGDIDTAGLHHHELEVTLANGRSYTFSQGSAIVIPTVYPTT